MRAATPRGTTAEFPDNNTTTGVASHIHFAPPPGRYDGDYNFQNSWNPPKTLSPQSPVFETRPISGSTAERRPSDTSSRYSARSLYPPPSKPLPALPPTSPTRRLASSHSFSNSSLNSSRFSQSSRGVSSSYLDQFPLPARTHSSPSPAMQSFVPKEEKKALDISLERRLQATKKKHGSIFYLDASATSGTLAAKHGKNMIAVWSPLEDDTCSIIKITAYTEAQCRSREYLIRSHSILSESSHLIAIATRFGTVVEIWNWKDKKCLQSIEKADRWTAGLVRSSDTGCNAVAVYHGETSSIDIFTIAPGKTPLSKIRSIDLREAELPFLIQYPELALSPTSTMLIAAAGPRPPKPGHPPPDRQTLLAAWEISGDAAFSDQPYMVVRPWQHEELETAIPCELATYGSVVVSAWIPAGFKIVPVPTAQGGETYNLSPVLVQHRIILVWDLASNSTRTFKIPNTISCLSPDCRFVAYCQASKTSIGGKGCLVILDVMSGNEIWRWPNPDATASDSGPKPGLEQFDYLSKVTELKFSADGAYLFVGDRDGQCCMYNIKS
jgi:hypothetical protein